MKNLHHALIVLFLITSNSLLAQIAFKPAFYLDNSGNKVECLIKDVDWKSNPTAFEYKNSENDLIQIAKIENVQEFQIGEFTKYVRKSVNIDRWDKYMAPSLQKGPIFKNETLFLKVLMEGSASLYEYADVSFLTFFYSVNGKELQQLVQKQYIAYDGKKDVTYKNDLYKKQLAADLKMEEFNTTNLSYFKKDFIKVFQKYNESKGETVIIASKDSFKFNLTPRLGLNRNQIEVQLTAPIDTDFDHDFGVKNNLRIGVELEGILPFNRSKWALVAEPVYTSYKGTTNGSDYIGNIDYQVLELHVVARHYMFLNPQSRLFINAGVLYSFDLKDITYKPERRYDATSFTIKPRYVLGAGYKHKKISAELRYAGSQNLVSPNNWDAQYKSYALIFGYELF